VAYFLGDRDFSIKLGLTICNGGGTICLMKPYSSVLERAAIRFPGISLDPDTLGGTPRIAGTRIPVYMILDAIEYYGDLAGAIKSYPNLSLNQVKEAVGFAVYVLEHPIEDKALVLQDRRMCCGCEWG
jgi:uncharacterized protein (DUF433 family)